MEEAYLMAAEKDEQIKHAFTTYQTIAVVGMSRSMKKPSNWIPVYLSSRYKVIPINPKAGRIKGWKSYSELKSIPGRIDIVQIFRPPDEALEIVKEAVARRKKRGDISVIWLQDVKEDEARELAESEGITFIQGRCMYKEYKRLMLKG